MNAHARRVFTFTGSVHTNNKMFPIQGCGHVKRKGYSLLRVSVEVKKCIEAIKLNFNIICAIPF